MSAENASAPYFAGPQLNAAWILGDRSLPAHVAADRVALRWADEARTYGELRRRALGLATSLHERGLQPGAALAQVLRNRGETFEMYFACAYAGLTLVPINFRMSPREISSILDDCAPMMLVTEPSQLDTVRAAVEDRDIQIVVLDEDRSGDEYDAMAEAEPYAGPVVANDPHLILYTSGTSGRPKGAMISHLSVLWFALQQAALYPEMSKDTVMLLTSPTFNTGTIHELSIPTFYVGGTACLLSSGNWNAERMVDDIERWGVTHALFFPSFLEPLLLADEQHHWEMPTLRWMVTGGEDAPAAVLARFRQRWPKVSVWYGYGLTEGGGIAIMGDDLLAEHPGSVGRTYAGQIFRIADAEGNPVPVGEVGEVLTTSPAMFSGYWNAPEMTANTIREGWVWTGDLGYQDAEGYLFLAGRSKDIIISAAQNIFSAEIEGVLAEHPDLLESTIIGVPDRRYGEAVCAVVVSKPSRTPTEDDIVSFVKERLASYKKPKYVVFRDELPRNQTNKVQKVQLREELKGIEDERAGAGAGGGS